MKQNTDKNTAATPIAITRRRVAVFIDYALRAPNFIGAYELFKSFLFSDKEFNVNLDDAINDNDPRLYWNEQMKNPDVEKFYLAKKPPLSNMDTKEGFQPYFYNDDHFKRFIDEFAFNLYVDTSAPNPQDIDLINIAQDMLFDVVLFDRYISKRKKSNTMFFLSKLRVYPQAIIFLGESQRLNESLYFGVWDPINNPAQVNKPGDSTFMDWFKELEVKQKNLDNASN